MAPNSSLFNDGPAETKPASAPTDTPLTSPVSTATTSSATVTTTPECTSKKVAPKMEAAIEGDLSGSTETSQVGSRLRFSRVSPAGLDESKKPITPGPKSILKPSSSFPTFDDSPHKPSNVLLAEVEGEKEPEPEVPAQKNRRRCWECKAKVGLTAVTCRCDYTFCNKHRYAEEHNCRFNFKVAAKRKLENENPRVVPSKVARIN